MKNLKLFFGTILYILLLPFIFIALRGIQKHERKLREETGDEMADEIIGENNGRK